MLEWLAKYWLEVLFSGVLAGGGIIIRKLWQQQQQIEANNRGTCALLRDRLIQAYYHYHDRGWITLHGLEAIDGMYAEYHNLGGNGTVTKLVEDLHALPVLDRAPIADPEADPEEDPQE